MSRGVENLGLLFLRVFVAGSMIVLHGWAKLSKPDEFAAFLESKGLFLTKVLSPAVLTYMSIAAETVFPFMLIIGLFTRFSALIASINMFVALLLYHVMIHGDPVKIWEKPWIYLGVFTFFTIAGGGDFTLDYAIASTRRRRSYRWRTR